MFLIRIYLRGRPGTHNLRKLMHAAGIREAMKISTRSFSPSVTRTPFPEIASRIAPIMQRGTDSRRVAGVEEGENRDNLRDLCDDCGSGTSRETNINT